MPPAKRSSPGRSTSSPSRSGSGRTSSSSRSTGARATQAAARGGAKSTATSARKGAARTTTQAKSGATKTRASAKSGAAKTATAARAGAKTTRTSAKAASTKATPASGGGVQSVAEQLAQGAIKPRDVVMLTRSHIQEALDDAASRGRVTRKDANDLVSELVRRGRGHGSELVKEVESLLGRAGAATKRARGSDSVDRIVRGADRARRAAGVGSTFPIVGYDDLNAVQVQGRIKELKKPELRKVLSYERKHANRKSVVGALEKSLA
jgi:polyhydroxyalkanoate synthesis regulator phasin